MNTNNFEFKFITSIDQINAQDWNDVVETDYPFIQHEFLQALETSGSVSVATGWQPSHLTVYQERSLIAVLPLYIKKHSYGEYVFDFQWANAYHQSGIQYYPKLLCAIPFTPCAGRRLYIKETIKNGAKEMTNENDYSQLVTSIIKAISDYAVNINASSWHLLFPKNKLIKEPTLLERLGVQYHWFNKNYASFDDFLARCKMKQRKNIKRERKSVERSGIQLQTIEGGEIGKTLWERFYYFYQRTYAKRSGNSGYLSHSFFEMLGQTMSDKIVMVIALQNEDIIAASLFFKDKKTLFGRYWGALEEYDFLHFEACYYQGIDYCIQHNLEHFDAGAQGEHKISRGFEPIETYSYHWISDERFKLAIKNFVNEESLYVKEAIEKLKRKLPFKADKL